MKEQNERKIKGVWIPIEIWDSKKLTILEKFLIAEIECLSSKERGCYATNKYLSDILGCSKGHIANMVSRLSGEYLSVSVIDGHKREIRTINYNTGVHSQMKGGSSQDEGGVHHRMKGGSSQDDSNTGEITKEKEESNICPATAEQPSSTKPVKEKKHATDSDGRRAAASRVVEYLNQRAMRNFSTGSKIPKPILSLILARFNEGYTEEQLKLVVDNRCSNWLGDDTMSKYLQPSTLFRPGKFVNYLEDATRSSGVSRENGPIYDIELSNDERAAYELFWSEDVRPFPNIAKSIRFFTASEYLGFFADEPAFSPKIWGKYQGDFRKSKIRQALTSLENDPQRNRTAPTGLCDYLKTWFLDERDGKH